MQNWILSFCVLGPVMPLPQVTETADSRFAQVMRTFLHHLCALKRQRFCPGFEVCLSSFSTGSFFNSFNSDIRFVRFHLFRAVFDKSESCTAITPYHYDWCPSSRKWEVLGDLPVTGAEHGPAGVALFFSAVRRKHPDSRDSARTHGTWRSDLQFLLLDHQDFLSVGEPSLQNRL